jgi:hypothetical protein
MTPSVYQTPHHTNEKQTVGLFFGNGKVMEIPELPSLRVSCDNSFTQTLMNLTINHPLCAGHEAWRCGYVLHRAG